MLTLKKLNENDRLSEIMQQVDIKFAYCYTHFEEDGSTVVEQTSSFFKCRDFFADILCSRFTNSNEKIYGFQWDLSKPFDVDFTTLLIKFPNDQTQQNFINNFYILKGLSKQNNFFDPFFEYIKENARILYFNADRWFQDSTFGISLLTFILKCLSYELPAYASDEWIDEVMKHETNEAYYLKSTVKNLRPLLPHLHRIMPTENPLGDNRIKKNVPSHPAQYHDTSGFVFFLSEAIENCFPKNSIWLQIKDVLKQQQEKDNNHAMQSV